MIFSEHGKQGFFHSADSRSKPGRTGKVEAGKDWKGRSREGLERSKPGRTRKGHPRECPTFLQNLSSKNILLEDKQSLQVGLSSKKGLCEDGVKWIYCGRQGMGRGRRSRPWLVNGRNRREAVGG